jgi:hypothetical protein
MQIIFQMPVSKLDGTPSVGVGTLIYKGHKIRPMEATRAEGVVVV